LQNGRPDRRSPFAGKVFCSGVNLPDWVRRGWWSISLNRATAGLDKGDWERMFLKRFRLKGLVHESKLARMTGGELKTRSASGAAVVDVRLGVRFAKGHFPGSLNVGLGDRSFAACVRLFLPKQSQTVLVVDKPEEASRAQTDLARAGFEDVLGFIAADDLPELHQLTQLSVLDLYSTLSRGGKPAMLDIRSPGEWKSDGIPGSQNIPLVQLPARVSELSLSNPLVVVCQDGYQSAVASSWLQAHEFDSIQQLLGGMDAYTNVPFNEDVEALSYCSLKSG
jgi:hydroxyacylglutathione hydrolase